MGKEKGNAQRTKGNAKVSSSARSAQILGSETSGFIGFGTATESGFVPLLQTDDGIPAEFRLVLRKMLKKDVTTKVKALQEFLELSSGSSEDVMNCVLPFWPAVYNKLAVDTDHRVRELTQVALKAIVTSVRKNLAPNLKSICGIWFLGQSDSYSPASEAALAAWSAAFPQPSKSVSAKEFCKDEIFSLIVDNLISATPQSLSDPKVTPSEEMESKYERTLCMSLTSYIKLIESVDNLNQDKHNKLLDSPKFWKFGRHKAIKVRRSFFTMISHLCEKMPEALRERGAKLAPAVLTCLGDQDAGVSVWEASINLLGVLHDPWSLVNPTKAVYPGIWSTLKTAAGGKPQSIFPLLMPFLGKVALDKMQDSEKFINQWFAGLSEGLAAIKSKRSLLCDSDVIIKTTIECIFYICNKCDLPQSVKSNLINDHLIPIVTDDTLGAEVSSCLVNYLAYWNKNAGSNPDIAQCNQYFWSSLHYISTQNQNLNPVLKINKCLPKETEISELNRIVTDIWTQQLQQLKEGNPEKVAQTLQILNCVLENFADQKRMLGSEDDLINVYNDSVLKIVGNLEVEDSVARFTWALAVSVHQDSGQKILQSFTEVTRPVAVGKILEHAVKSNHNKNLLESWLVSPAVQQVLTNILEQVIQQLNTGHTLQEENMNTLTSILKSGVFLPKDFQLKLIQDVAQTLQTHHSKPKLVEILSELTLLLSKSKDNIVAKNEEGISLVKAIFNLDTSTFAETNVNKVDSCWQSIAALHTDLVTVLSHDLQCSINKECTLSSLERLVVKAGDLTRIAARQSQDKLADVLEILFSDIDYNLAQAVWYPLLFHQRLYYPQCSERLEESLFQQSRVEPDNLILANRSLVFISVLSNVYDIKSDSTEDEERTIPEEERVNISEKILNGCILSKLLDCIVAVVYMQNLVEDSNASQDIRTLEIRLSKSATTLFSRLGKRTLDVLEIKIFEKCKSNDVMYCLGLSWLLGVTYRYSDWDLRLNRFIKPEQEDISSNYNILVTLLRLSSRFNLGSGSLSSYVSLATGQLLSIQGMKTDEGTCLLWFIVQCLDLVRPGSRLHVSGVADLAGEVKVLLELVKDWKEESETDLLYSSDVSNSTWSDVNKVCTVINLLNLTVNKFIEQISSELWDLIMCSLVQWVASMEESKDSLCSRPGCMMFGIAVSNLVATVSKALRRRGVYPALSTGYMLEQSADQSEKDSADDSFAVSNKLRDEWEEFFAEGIFTVLVPLYIKVCTGKEELYSCALLCTSMGEALVHTPLTLLVQCELPPLYMVQDVDATELPDNITFILNNFGPKLSCSYRSFQVTAAHILAAVTKEIPQHIDASSDAEEFEIPRRLLEIMNQGEMVMSSLLAEFSISDSVPEIPSGTVAFSHSLGYLLCWRVVLCLLEHSSDIVRPRFSQYLQSNEHISKLLENIFKLLPQNPSQLEDVFTPSHIEVAASASISTSRSGSSELGEMAASCWTQVCRHLPAFVRQWWSRLDKGSQTSVEKITCNYVTPALWAKEVQIINSSQKSENLKLKVRETVREVVATYSIDEGSMELVVTLPSNYPLGGLTVDSAKRVGVETAQWRKWMLQLTTFLTHQNGSICEGLDLWKKNVDKRFEGVEECYICFYILHGSNHQLPKLGCRTCKKKFHSACLYKWFSTSNNSTCPLCRNLF